MADQLLDPLVPAGVDLRDFAFMPLHVVQLRDSSFAIKATGEEFRAGVLLWCASWHQLPAASLPDDDTELAQLAGFGRVVKEWRAVREGALRGWVKCSDGRLYHPVVAAKALDAWRGKMEQRWRTECSRIKKHNQRHGTNLETPDLEDWLSRGCPQGQVLTVPRTKAECPEDTARKSPGTNGPCPHPVPGEMHSKGQGEGQGQGQGIEKQSPDGDTSAAAGAAGGPPAELDQGMPACPHEAIIALYHRELPTLPRVREWTPKRAKALRARWREKPKRQELAWWERYFRYVARSDFLTGRASQGDGHSWQCDLEWLVQASNLVKVIEGKYENREAA